jgi:hypothetical protein
MSASPKTGEGWSEEFASLITTLEGCARSMRDIIEKSASSKSIADFEHQLTILQTPMKNATGAIGRAKVSCQKSS